MFHICLKSRPSSQFARPVLLLTAFTLSPFFFLHPATAAAPAKTAGTIAFRTVDGISGNRSVTATFKTTAGPLYDYRIKSLTLLNGTSPESLIVRFQLDIVGPVSSDSLAPTIHFVNCRILFNGTPVETDHWVARTMYLRDIACGFHPDCDPAICAKARWEYKGSMIEDVSRCVFLPDSTCTCPPISDPSPQDKPVGSPVTAGVFELILDPDDIYPEIDETNNRATVAYSPVGVGDRIAEVSSGIRVCGRNPTREAVQIVYTLATGGIAKICVYDIVGRLVSIPVNERQLPGEHQTNWDARTRGRNASGLYFVQLSLDERKVGSRRVVILE